MAEYTEDLCEGGVASASSAASGEGAEKAFDGLNSGWEAANEFPAWLKYQFTEAVDISKYTIKATSAVQAPNDWTFQGSNNDVDWDDLDTQTNIVFTTYETKEFTFSNTTDYIYYRINVTGYQSGFNPSTQGIEIGEVEMMSEIVTNPYVRPDNITGLYNLSSQGSLRGKASEGFVRPTLTQFIAPYKQTFEEISALKLVPTTWDVNRKHPSAVITNDDLRLKPAAYNQGSARTVFDGVTEGKYYWEMHINTIGQLVLGIFSEAGLHSGGYPYGFPGRNPGAYHSSGYFHGGIESYMTVSNSYVTDPEGQATAGDRMGFALDLEDYKIHYYRNGNYIGFQNVDPGEKYFPGLGNQVDVTGTATAHFDPEGFLYDVPVGYTPGFGPME